MSRRGSVVQVVSVSQLDMSRNSKDTLDRTMTRLDQTAALKPDIVCLPECCPGHEPEPVPGPTVERVAAWARDHRSYAICPLQGRMDGELYNVAVLLDRRGEIAGHYCKIHPTVSELDLGIRPGPLDPPVFQTDFGTIGIQICYDVNWHDGWRRLKEKGAQVVFYSSGYPAARQAAALAWMNEYYVVSSVNTGPSSIFDISGDLLDQSGAWFRNWAGAALELDKRVFEVAGDFREKLTTIVEKYGPKVRLRWINYEDWFTLASVDPETPLDDVMAEFGLVPRRRDLSIAEQRQEAARPKPARP